MMPISATTTSYGKCCSSPAPFPATREGLGATGTRPHIFRQAHHLPHALSCSAEGNSHTRHLTHQILCTPPSHPYDSLAHTPRLPQEGQYPMGGRSNVRGIVVQNGRCGFNSGSQCQDQTARKEKKKNKTKSQPLMFHQVLCIQRVTRAYLANSNPSFLHPSHSVALPSYSQASKPCLDSTNSSARNAILTYLIYQLNLAPQNL